MKAISNAEKLTYTGSLLGQNMIYSFVTMYVMFFFTDLLRIPSESVTIIMVAASLWDAVNDILMGMIADRTKTRWGKFRPYLLAGPFVIAVTTVLCFWNFGGSAVERSPWRRCAMCCGECPTRSMTFPSGRSLLSPRMTRMKRTAW